MNYVTPLFKYWYSRTQERIQFTPSVRKASDTESSLLLKLIITRSTSLVCFSLVGGVLHSLRRFKEKTAADIGCNSSSFWTYDMVVRLQQTPDWKPTSRTVIDGVMNFSDCYIRHSNQSSSAATRMLTVWNISIREGKNVFLLNIT